MTLVSEHCFGNTSSNGHIYRSLEEEGDRRIATGWRGIAYPGRGRAAFCKCSRLFAMINLATCPGLSVNAHIVTAHIKEVV